MTPYARNELLGSTAFVLLLFTALYLALAL
jgi:hypothetical protein